MGAHSCPSCQVVFEKHNKKIQGLQDVVVASTDVSTIWQQVLADYENRNLHDQFIQKCFAEKNLPYASQQYRKMLELNGQDAIANKMQAQIVTMLMATINLNKKNIRPRSTVTRNFFIVLISALLFIVLITLMSFKK